MEAERKLLKAKVVSAVGTSQIVIIKETRQVILLLGNNCAPGAKAGDDIFIAEFVEQDHKRYKAVQQEEANADTKQG